MIQELLTTPEPLRFPPAFSYVECSCCPIFNYMYIGFFSRTLFILTFCFGHCIVCLSIYSIFTLFLQAEKAQNCVYKGGSIIIKSTNGHHVHHITNCKTKLSFHFMQITGDVIAVIIYTIGNTSTYTVRVYHH